MAPSRQVLLLAAVACLTSLASGTQWTVGDSDGWRAKFNETGWTDGKTFMVGDTLLFKYRKGIHNVVQVGEDGFATCSGDDGQLGAWISGDDTVELDKPGTMWFICTRHNHCLNGMKLAIDVVDITAGPSPSPMPMPFPFPASPRPFRFPRPRAPAPAPSPLFRRPLFPWPFSPAPAPAPAPPASPAADELLPFAGVRNPGGSTVAAAAAAVVAAALAF